MKQLPLALLVLSLAVWSCTGRKSEKDASNDILLHPTIHLEQRDTAEVVALLQDYVQAFQTGDYQRAAEMLHIVRNDSILALPSDAKESFVARYTALPIYGVRLKAFTFRSDKNNQADLILQVTESGDLEQETGVMHQALNPVQKDGHWYLTLLDKNAEGVEDIYHPEEE